MATPAAQRIASIDILRALTMLLMIFVNDLWTLKNIPGWLEHTAAQEDGMGLADSVFSAFLFIVGMSIPYAIRHRRSKGDSNGKIILHIGERSLALLIMGLFLVNGEYLNETATGISRAAWNSLSCLAFIFLWNVYPKTINPWVPRILKTIAVGILLVLAFICRSGEGQDLQRFTPHWWGILGLIGWAYLVGSIVITLTNSRIIPALIAWVIFMAINISAHAGLIENDFVKTLIGPLGVGGHAGLVLGGALASLVFGHCQQNRKYTRLTLVLLALAIAWYATGVYTRQFWGISKIRVTPAWVLICSALTVTVFVIVYWIADQYQKAKWFAFITPAGNNTLLCYLLPYFAYAIFVSWLSISLPEVLLTGGTGLIKSLLFSLLIVGAAGLLGKWGIRLKL